MSIRGLSALILWNMGFWCSAQLPEPEKSVSPYEIVENRGQWHPMMRYKLSIPFGEIYLENDALTYNICQPEDYLKIQEFRHDHPGEQPVGTLRKHAVRMRFMGMEHIPKASTSFVQKHYYNYFFGQDANEWVSGLHPAKRVRYHDVYPGVDFELDVRSNIKYQWIIHQPSREKVSGIKCQIEGADSFALVNERLAIYTYAGVIWEEAPYVYQEINGNMYIIPAAYQLQGDVLSYVLKADFYPDYPLIIDPKLIFSTYSGSVGDNFGFTATYDSRGSLYAGGIVNGNLGPYPVTAGAYDVTYNGGSGTAPANLSCDISISKYDSAGTSLLWATYLGGANDEYPHSLVCDHEDNLILLGTSYSANFPFSDEAFDKTHNGGTDIIVSKFSPDGTDLIASTFIGGDDNDGLVQNGVLKHNYADDYRGDVIPDDDNHIFVATSTNSSGLPVVNGTQPDNAGILDGYAFELNEDFSELLWATYLGGIAMDAMYSIKLDLHDNIFIGGGTTSSNLPTGDSVFQKNREGGVDGFIANYHKQTKVLKGLTYWGTGAYDQIYFIDLDKEGFVYATGQTEGNVTKSPGTYGENNRGQFIFKIDTALTTVEFQTTFGNTANRANLVPSAFLIDVCEHIYFSGWASAAIDPNLPGNSNMDISADAEQDITDNEDFYILVLDKNASALLYATYFGGDSTGDHVDGGTSRFDKRGVIYQSVCASCPEQGRTGYNDFPVTNQAAFTENVSVRCSNASFKIDLQIKTAVIAEFSAEPVLGCKPLDVRFNNSSVLGEYWIWNFGDGDTSTAINPEHTYSEPGLYTVTLTVIDSNTCNISDSYSRTILVLDKGIAKFTAGYNECTNQLSITNESEGAFSYDWDFGDDSISTEANPRHQYAESGDYTIQLVINAQSLCSDTFSLNLGVDIIGEEYFKLYNVFTPNGDQINDCFRFDGLETLCDEFVWRVYNRWGEKLFQTDDPFACWNGRLPETGDNLPEGTYFYILDLNPGSKSRNDLISGTITLIR